MLQLQSVNLPIELTEDLVGDTGWKVLVCLTDYQIPIDVAINSVETFCGTAVGRGVPSFNPSGNAIAEIAPTTNQATYSQMVAWLDAGTVLRFRVRNLSGGSAAGYLFLSGQCTVTNVTLNATAGSAVGFSFTLSGQGELSTTPTP